MNEQTISIIGWRSGTSLLAADLMSTGQFIPWRSDNLNVKSYEAPIAQQIFWDFPVITNSMFESNLNWNGTKKWNLIKMPEAVLVYPRIKAKYNAKFIVMKRSLEDRIRSAIMIDWDEIIYRRIRNTPFWKIQFDDYINKKQIEGKSNKITFKELAVRFWAEFIEKMENELIKTTSAIIIDFDEYMKKPFDVLSKLFKELRLKHSPKKTLIMLNRSEKHSEMSNSLEHYNAIMEQEF